ncbi:MAG: hypothetical protein DMG60_01690 [Acidobacteria bacterium]|nr:MAG: hypothetical protein DMG60_01690 [Acidobacteriota bacterium]
MVRRFENQKHFPDNHRFTTVRVRWVLYILTAFFFCSPNSFSQAPASRNDVTQLRTAAELIVRGDLEQAERELQTVLAVNPTESRALNLLGIVRTQQHRNQDAERLFKEALQHRPEYAGAHASLGLLYADTGRLDSAVEELQEALKLDPTRQDASLALVSIWRKQASAAVTQGELERALSFLIKARKRNPQDPDAAYEFGMVTLRMSLFSDAVQAFQDVLKVRRDDHNAVYALGRARIGLRKYQDAKDSFSEYTRLRPDDPSGHYGLGLVLRSLEQTKEARVQFERSVALQPAQTESYVQLGKLDLDERNLDSAADRFNHALQRDPRNAGALLGMGEVEFQRKRYQTSKDFLSRAIASDPSSRESHYYLGLVYGRLGRLDDSKQEFEVASKLEHEELEKQRTLWSLVDPAEIDSAQPK